MRAPHEASGPGRLLQANGLAANVLTINARLKAFGEETLSSEPKSNQGRFPPREGKIVKLPVDVAHAPVLAEIKGVVSAETGDVVTVNPALF